MTANSCIDALFITDLMLSLCVKSSSLNFFRVCLKLYIYLGKMLRLPGDFVLQIPDRGSAPDAAGGAYSAPSDPLAGFQGPTSKGIEGKGRGREKRGGEV